MPPPGRASRGGAKEAGPDTAEGRAAQGRYLGFHRGALPIPDLPLEAAEEGGLGRPHIGDLVPFAHGRHRAAQPPSPQASQRPSSREGDEGTFSQWQKRQSEMAALMLASRRGGATSVRLLASNLNAPPFQSGVLRTGGKEHGFCQET